jgi:hypothetical protein
MPSGEGGNHPISKDDVDEIFKKWSAIKPKPVRYALMPSEEHQDASSHQCAKKLIPWFGGSDPKRAYFIVMATVVYWSDMDETWHRTDRSFTIGKKVGDLEEPLDFGVTVS